MSWVRQHQHQSLQGPRKSPLVSLHLTLSLSCTGIYGVGKAALHPPALAVLSHTPDGATQTIAWVGKGIVYDTGGLSIKGKVRCGFWGAVQTSVSEYLMHEVSGVGDCFI